MALEVVGSSPITHPSALLHKNEASNAEVSSLSQYFYIASFRIVSLVGRAGDS